LLGQPAELIDGAAAVLLVLAPGSAVSSDLRGIRPIDGRVAACPTPGMVMTLLANVLNLIS